MIMGGFMKKAIMLIHGYITSPMDFMPLYEPLYCSYNHIEKVTLPGHEEDGSYKNFKFDKTIDLLKKTYERLISEYEQLDLIGFSLGGALASYLACNYKFNSVVLLSPCNKYLRLGFLNKYFHTLNIYKREYKKNLSKDLSKANSYKLKEKDIIKNNKISMKLGIFHLFPNYTPRTISVFRRLVKFSNANLKITDTRCLIIWGKLDQLVPYRSIKHLKKYFINHKEIIYDDISHLMLRSVNYEQVVEDIINFLNV